MVRYDLSVADNESVYIAGPECFYQDGNKMLASFRLMAELSGYSVTLPNDHKIDTNNTEKQKNADNIFKDLIEDMRNSTVIISDLESFRGTEPDSGTVFEIGMAYAKGIKSYGYTRDKRKLSVKNELGTLRDAVCAYGELAFAPSVIGSTKIIEGSFLDCLKMLTIDLEENQKNLILDKTVRKMGKIHRKDSLHQPIIYLASSARYDPDGDEKLERMKQICNRFGYKALSPLDSTMENQNYHKIKDYSDAIKLFNQYQDKVRACDVIIADLNFYRGFEVSNDVGFECGFGFGLGKRLYGYMDNTDKLINKIPNYGPDFEYRDQSGCQVEDFDYPVNLMFACSMKIFEGKFEDIIELVIKDIKR